MKKTQKEILCVRIRAIQNCNARPPIAATHGQHHTRLAILRQLDTREIRGGDLWALSGSDKGEREHDTHRKNRR